MKSLFQNELLWVLVIYTVAVGFVPIQGNFPLNDDWVYAKSALMSSEAGRYVVEGHESAWGMPQVTIGALMIKQFGFSHGMLRYFGIAMLFLAALTLWLYLKQVCESRMVRFAAVGSFVFFTPTFQLSASFMSDVPFIVFWLLAAYCWERVHLNPTKLWGVVAIGATLLAAVQRQFGIFHVAASFLFIWFSLVWRPRSLKQKAFYSSLCVAGFVVFTFLQRWWAGQGGYSPGAFPPYVLGKTLENIHEMFMLFGFFFLPLMVLVFKRSYLESFIDQIKTQKWRALKDPTLFLMFFCLVLTVSRALAGRVMPYTGNLLSVFGFFGSEIILGVRHAIFHGWVGWLFTPLCLIGAWALILCLRGDGKDYNPLSWWAALRNRITETTGGFGVYLVYASGVYVCYLLLFQHFFDRYLLPAVPGVLLALCVSVPKITLKRSIAAATLTVLMAVFSTSLVLDYFGWSKAKWEAAEWLTTEQGLDPKVVDGGNEWRYWYLIHPVEKRIGIVSFSPLPGFDVLKEFSYPTVWKSTNDRLYALRRNEKPSR